MPKEDAGSKELDEKLRSLGDWRGAMLARLRRWIREADPEVTEAVKWRKPSNPAGVPVCPPRPCPHPASTDRVPLAGRSRVSGQSAVPGFPPAPEICI